MSARAAALESDGARHPRVPATKRVDAAELSVEYHKGFLQRRYRMSSETLVFNLQFRLRCSHCNRRAGFRITILDTRTRGDSLKPRLSGWLWRGSELRPSWVESRVRRETGKE
jgi:hypothetical protein